MICEKCYRSMDWTGLTTMTCPNCKWTYELKNEEIPLIPLDINYPKNLTLTQEWHLAKSINNKYPFK